MLRHHEDTHPLWDQLDLVRLKRRHLPAVLRIEATAHPRPWSMSIFLSELAEGDRRLYLAARSGHHLVGYAGMMLTGLEAHVTNIAVDQAWRRRQVGLRLMYELVSRARAQGVVTMSLEVRAGNDQAQALYRRFGFQNGGLRRNYYRESNEDALVMWVQGMEAEAYGFRLAAIAAEGRSRAAGARPGLATWRREMPGDRNAGPNPPSASRDDPAP
jgi:ribosomal-protein-alanine N-acetyltransferase